MLRDYPFQHDVQDVIWADTLISVGLEQFLDAEDHCLGVTLVLRQFEQILCAFDQIYLVLRLNLIYVIDNLSKVLHSGAIVIVMQEYFCFASEQSVLEEQRVEGHTSEALSLGIEKCCVFRGVKLRFNQLGLLLVPWNNISAPKHSLDVESLVLCGSELKHSVKNVNILWYLSLAVKESGDLEHKFNVVRL